MNEVLASLILGVVEGLTEFLPVSSTGHLIVAADWLAFESGSAKTFEVFIQVGAILAVTWTYRRTLLGAVIGWRHDPKSRHLLTNLGLGFLPAAVAGFLLHEFIKEQLFSPTVVGIALMVGGVAILLVERTTVTPRHSSGIADVPARVALGVGFAQVLALIPGVSRSAATILGGVSLGLTRRDAAEFSFLLSVPVIVAAAAFDLWAGRGALSTRDVPIFLTGLVSAYLVALLVIRLFLAFVARFSFRAFGWYRIAVGGLIVWLYTR